MGLARGRSTRTDAGQLVPWSGLGRHAPDEHTAVANSPTNGGFVRCAPLWLAPRLRVAIG
jgi:hypothetical protein